MTVAASRLRRLASRAEPAPRADGEERCDLCSEPLGPEHRHVVDLHHRSLLCACRSCTILFSRPGSGGDRLRLVPERRLRLEGFRLDDARWASLQVPVDVAFFFRSSGPGRVAAFYPGALGPTESLLELEAWSEIERDNAVLGGLEPDVEALLVHRVGGRRDHYLVPIDECYALAGLVRTHWRGLAGGAEVWRELAAYFDRLDERSERKEAR